MGDFGTKLQDLAQVCFDQALKVEKDLEDAYTKQREANVNRNKDELSLARAMEADALVKRAQEQRHNFRMGVYKLEQKADALVDEYAKHLDDRYAVNPEQVDMRIVTLMNSGIMKPADYEHLYIEAEKAGNVTMMRLIGQQADKASKDYDGKDGVRLSGIAIHSREIAGGEELKGYQECVSVFKRCLNNPSLIPEWESLVGDALEELC